MWRDKEEFMTQDNKTHNNHKHAHRADSTPVADAPSATVATATVSTADAASTIAAPTAAANAVAAANAANVAAAANVADAASTTAAPAATTNTDATATVTATANAAAAPANTATTAAATAATTPTTPAHATPVTRVSTAPTNEEPAQALLKALGTTLEPQLLVQALTHRSFSHEHPGAPNYERLEFLGDAVLELVATETLFAAHPDMSEGQLAKMRAKAVSEESLSAIAREKLHVSPYILLGKGEMEQHGNEKSSILCDIVESLIGATFISHGIDEARRVVHRLVDDTLAEVATEGPALDWKTSLEVKAHLHGMGDPRYRMAISGPEYAQIFTAEALIGDDDKVYGTGTGTSKRKAQLAAAEQAWRALGD